jgi:hypothetical protein
MSIHQLHQPTAPLRKIAMRAYDQYALVSRLAHPLSQILYAGIAKGLSSLIRAILNLIIGHILHLLARLHLTINHLIDRMLRVGLATPADPGTTLTAH